LRQSFKLGFIGSVISLLHKELVSSNKDKVYFFLTQGDTLVRFGNFQI